MEGDDAGAIRSAQDELARASHKLAEAMYAKTAGEQPGAGPGAGPEAGPKAGGAKKDDNVVDAEFEENK